MSARDLTLAISGYGGTPRALRTVLGDWVRFIGSRPREVVYVDGGSGPRTTGALRAMVHQGLIDKLELLNPASWENSFHRCYIQEYQSGSLATSRLVMFVKLDMLPFRRGADAWLEEESRALEDPGVFAVTNAHLLEPARERRAIAGRDYDVHDFVSLNFALMKKSAFDAAMEEGAGDFIRSRFRGEYPPGLGVPEKDRRALVEWCWQAYARRHRLAVLSRPEHADWTIYHINKGGRKLLEYRRRYLARWGVEGDYNRPKALYRPPFTPVERAGRSVEAWVRGLRGLVKRP